LDPERAGIIAMTVDLLNIFNFMGHGRTHGSRK
jgi:hypothetical protein